MSESHILYRFYDAGDRLLYVGITNSPPARFRQHRGGKDWWDTVTAITLERFHSRADLAAEERVAILVERPRYNIVHNRGTGRSELGPYRHPRHIGTVYHLQRATCQACGHDALYDPVADIYRHERGLIPVQELIRGSRTLTCYLTLVRQGVTAR